MSERKMAVSVMSGSSVISRSFDFASWWDMLQLVTASEARLWLSPLASWTS
jgi:hypothetical protein